MDETIMHHLHSIVNDAGHLLYHKVNNADRLEITLKCMNYSLQQIQNTINNLNWDEGVAQ